MLLCGFVTSENIKKDVKVVLLNQQSIEVVDEISFFHFIRSYLHLRDRRACSLRIQCILACVCLCSFVLIFHGFSTGVQK